MRKLVTIRTVDKLLPIKKADRIEIAIIGGWSCIVKKGEFSEGDKGLFFEIDSWIPGTDTRFEFLGSTKDYNGNPGWRIKTMKMRGVISQGLLLPLSSFTKELESLEIYDSVDVELATINGTDITETLNVLKWEAQERSLTGTQYNQVKKDPKFPRFIPKTDQERIQNLMHYFEIHKDTEFEETLKLDGSSCTMFKVERDLTWFEKVKEWFGFKQDPIKFGVCSRNLELSRGANYEKTFINDGKESVHKKSDFWDMAVKYDVENKLPVGYAIQGELIGPKIQGNHEKVTENEYHLFDIYDIKAQQYLTPTERAVFYYNHLQNIPHTKVVNASIKIFAECPTLEELQERVTGLSINGKGTISEGRVYKSIKDPSMTFKLISNKYLLKCED